jgi:hypothetical protein
VRAGYDERFAGSDDKGLHGTGDAGFGDCVFLLRENAVNEGGLAGGEVGADGLALGINGC